MAESIAQLQAKLKKARLKTKRRDLLEAIADLCFKEGDHKSAYEHYLQCESLKDEILNEYQAYQWYSQNFNGFANS